MSPQAQELAWEHDQLGSAESFAKQPTNADYRRASGLLALSAEDKARIGNLIKVLAKERRDKEDLREKLGQQAVRLQDLEREREVSQQKEAELVARVTRSVDLLRTYQLEASNKQGPDEICEEADIVRLSPELPPLPQLRLLRPEVAKEPPEVKESESSPHNDLRSADPVPSEAVASARQPANSTLEQHVFALKPPQLSVLQRYLSVQDSQTKCQNAERQQDTAEWPAQSQRATSSATMSPQRSRVNDSLASPGSKPRATNKEDGKGHQAHQGHHQEHQRLRLGRRHCRWTQCRASPTKAFGVKLDTSHSPARSRQSSEIRARVRNASADSRLTRTLDVPPEPLLGSPLATSSARQSLRKSPGMSLESLNHWPPLRLESCYAPNMFDVIDSLESGSRVAPIHEKVSAPSISEELRRLQRELVTIQHKISQGPTWGSPLDTRVRTQAWGEDSPSPQREILSSLGHWKPLETEESHELSQEIDDVLGLLQSMKSKDEKAEASQFL